MGGDQTCGWVDHGHDAQIEIRFWSIQDFIMLYLSSKRMNKYFLKWKLTYHISHDPNPDIFAAAGTEASDVRTSWTTR